MGDKRQLPSSWSSATLDQFTQARGTSINPAKFPGEEFELYSVPAFQSGEPEVVAGSDIGSSKQVTAPGNVLLCKINPRINRVWVVGNAEARCQIASTEWIQFPGSECLNPKFLRYYLCQDAVRNFLSRNASGVGGSLMRVKPSTLKSYPVPIAPFDEQRRIVEKIEALFARIDKGEEALREVQKLLKRYRQSILKAAVTGELTREWREANQHKLEPACDLLARTLEARRENLQRRGKYKEPLETDSDVLPKLPEGWVWTTMDQLGEVLGGLTKNSKRLELPLKRPMLRVANVYQNSLNLEEIHETGVSEKELERVRLESLDILIVEGNGSKDQIGRMAIWRNEIPDAVHQNHLIKARLLEKRLAEYVLTWFQAPIGRQIVEVVASSTSGLYTLSLSKIKQLAVPLPSLPEAQEIVAKVQNLFSQVGELEDHCDAELRRSISLRQSILKSAFTGQLVPQDPSDEPASLLLANIRSTSQMRQA